MWRTAWGAIVRVSYIWKVALAAGLSWNVAEWGGLKHPYFAPLAAILCLQVTVTASVRRSVERVVGIVGGVILADVTASALGLHGWSIALLVLVGLTGARLLHLQRTAVPQVAVSALMVLSAGSHHLGYSFDRVINTFIGALIALLVNLLILPPDYSSQATRAVKTAGVDLARRFTDIGQWLQSGASLASGRELQKETHAYLETLHQAAAEGELALAEVSYSWLARRRRSKLAGLHTELLRLRQGYAHAAGVLRTLIEWEEATGGIPRQVRERWAEHFGDASDAVLTWANTVVGALGTTSTAYGSNGDGSNDANPLEKFAQRYRWLFDHDAKDFVAFFEGALWNDLRQLIEELRQPAELVNASGKSESILGERGQ